MAHKKRFHGKHAEKHHSMHHSEKHSGMHPKEHFGERLESLGSDMYAGMDNRRAIERRDSGMISEDKHAVANMPQHVVYREWPKARHYHDYGLDDTIRGIDHQQDKDNAKMEQHLQPEKY